MNQSFQEIFENQMLGLGLLVRYTCYPSLKLVRIMRCSSKTCWSPSTCNLSIDTGTGP